MIPISTSTTRHDANKDGEQRNVSALGKNAADDTAMRSRPADKAAADMLKESLMNSGSKLRGIIFGLRSVTAFQLSVHVVVSAFTGQLPSEMRGIGGNRPRLSNEFTLVWAILSSKSKSAPMEINKLELEFLNEVAHDFALPVGTRFG